MRFLIDMPLSPGLAQWIRSIGHDAVHALAIGLDRAADHEILARARDEQRIVVTADLDYPRLLATTRTDGPPVILLRGGNYSEAQARSRLEAVISRVPESELVASIVVVDRRRIRRRQLPL